MDPPSNDDKPKVPKKLVFKPKPPVNRPRKPVAPKKEVVEDTEAAEKIELLRRLQDGLAGGKPKIEKKSEPVRVAFGHGSSISNNQNNASNSFYPRDDKPRVSSLEGQKEYVEPWNYYGNYPTTLPLRRPYSGNPEILDEIEFGEHSTTFDETSINSASELGLMDENEGPKMLFLQLPKTLPSLKRTTAEAGQASNNGLKPPSGTIPVEKPCGVNELEAGFMGKMMVYKSGAVKLKLGDTIYDVTPGSDCVFAQDVVAINTDKKHCCTLGELNKRAIVTPDVDSILDNFADLDI